MPLLINSKPRDGRAQCVQCGECIGFACPTDAKNGTHNTMIPRALATRRTTLVEGARALRLVADAAGTVTGVDLIDEATGARRLIKAGQIVVAAGAIETARLLLLSPSARDGRHRQHSRSGRPEPAGASYTSAFGTFDEEVIDTLGHRNLWIMDASLHVSNGGVSPVLTIYALALRNAERLVRGGAD